MKINLMLLRIVLLSSFTAATQADVTVDITGSSTMRGPVLDTIKAGYLNSSQPFKFAHDQPAGDLNSSVRAIFIGTFPGVSGTTTIRTSFNGSVEGIRAITNIPSANPTYFNPTDSGITSVTAVVGGAEIDEHAGSVVADGSEIAFSDVSIAATPYFGNQVLPADPTFGVVVYTMIANEGAPADLTNVTNKQFQALFSNGFQPLSLFTGEAADTALVFAMGRNDGAGTRTIYMAETGLEITTLVNQFVTRASTSTAVTQIQRVPASDGLYASTIWGQDLDGNGGYFNGLHLRNDMMKTSASVEILDSDNTSLGTYSIHLITFLSVDDAVRARVNGAKILGYNGVMLTSLITGTTLDATDKAKITEGQYTAWAYEQMYRRSDITSGDALTVYNWIRNYPVLGANGIPLNDMHVGRAVEGGIVAP